MLGAIDTDHIVTETLLNEDVNSALKDILERTEMRVDENIGKDMLLNMASLYVRVRCFAKAKYLLEQTKQKEQQTLKKKRFT